jgi:hypothetical protein
MSCSPCSKSTQCTDLTCWVRCRIADDPFKPATGASSPGPLRLFRRTQNGEAKRSFGAMSQRPFSASPSRAAKHAAESKRGQHSQSIEPSRPDAMLPRSSTRPHLRRDALSGGPRSLRTADGRGRAAYSGRLPDGQDGMLRLGPGFEGRLALPYRVRNSNRAARSSSLQVHLTWSSSRIEDRMWKVRTARPLLPGNSAVCYRSTPVVHLENVGYPHRFLPQGEDLIP